MFDFAAVDQLELSGKPATIQTVIDALWADDFHEQEPMTGAPEVCLCWVCQSLVPALKQVEQAHETELAALRERVGELETALKNISDKVNAAATALNYPESPEEDSPTSEAYNHGFWDCAEMAIKEINAALTAEGNA